MVHYGFNPHGSDESEEYLDMDYDTEGEVDDEYESTADLDESHYYDMLDCDYE